MPSLLDNFCHAAITDVTCGPRRELTLTLQPLVWVGNQGHYGPSVDIHFSGIIDYDEAVALFSNGCKKSHELAWIRYDDEHQSNSGDLYIDIAFERVEARVIIHCSRLSVTRLKDVEDT